MICEHCGTFFCWDDADSTLLGNTPRRFCTKACKVNHGKRSSRRDYRDRQRDYIAKKACEDRRKLAYGSEEEASCAAERLRRTPPLHPYLCRCGSWHLTSQQAETA